MIISTELIYQLFLVMYQISEAGNTELFNELHIFHQNLKEP